jgi:squalene cyclase
MGALEDALAVDASIIAARDYVLARQTRDGSWTDWALPPGSSSTWTSAYVGWHLNRLPDPLRADVSQALARSARWLRERQFSDGGWGYNEAVGSDADSTSFSILLLDAALGGAPANAVDHLLGYQQPNGGFATYRADRAAGSWTAPHADVTPIALLALLPHLGVRDSRIRRGIARVLREQSTDGAWHSFWWSSRSYATHASLTLLRAVGCRSRRPVELSHVEPDNAFETALLLACELDAVTAAGTTSENRISRRIERRVDRLIGMQRSDGSWTTVPMLRITRRDCFEPWAAANPGPLFADPHRLFTTATVLDALLQARRERHPRAAVAAMRRPSQLA